MGTIFRFFRWVLSFISSWVIFPPSARERSFRLSVFIILIIVIAVASLAWRNVHVNIPGITDFERGGTGPLGLKLGLDLRGGGHLVYQADTGTNFEVSFLDPITTEEVRQALSELRFGEEELSFEEFEVKSINNSKVRIKTDLLNDDDPRRTEFLETVTETLGTIFSVDITDSEPPTEEQMRGVKSIIERRVNLFGTEEPIIQLFGDDRIIVQLPGASGSITEITFVEPVPEPEDEANLRSILVRAGFEELEIERTSDRSFRINSNTVGGASRESAAKLLSDEMGALDLELRFPDAEQAAINVEALQTIFASAGFQEVTLEQRDDRTYKIRSVLPTRVQLEEAERQLGSSLITAVLGEPELELGFQVSSGIDKAKDLIGQTAQLEFKERTCTGGISLLDGSCLGPTDSDIGLTGEDLSRAYVSTDQLGQWAISIEFNGRGTDIFDELTQRIVNREEKRIAIFLDDDLVTAPVSRAWIRTGQSQITGNFTRERARDIVIQLESGRLPVPLEIIQEKDVDARLGSESLRNTLIAGIVGLGLVMAFMIAYYRMAGVVASVSLIFYAAVVLSVFKLFPITLTLSHIGGFVLSIGMAVDANVLIFERMKEEVRIGRTLASSMEVGFNRAWPAIRDGNISTLITCLVLIWFGDRLASGLVTGFAISLGIGVLASMFTAIIVSRNLLQLLAWVGLSHRIGLFTPEGSQRAAPTTGGGR